MYYANVLAYVCIIKIDLCDEFKNVEQNQNYLWKQYYNIAPTLLILSSLDPLKKSTKKQQNENVLTKIIH